MARPEPAEGSPFRMLILNVLAPVFLIIGLGVALAKTGFVSDAFLREANRVTYWLGLPALLFSNLSQSFHNAASAKPMLITLVGATFAVVVLAYAVSRLLKLDFSAYGTFAQGAFRGNLAYVGLPIIATLPEIAGLNSTASRAAAVVAIAPMLVLYNVLGVGVLVTSQHTLNRRMLWPLVRQLATTPPLIATLLGIAWAVFSLPLPPAFAQTFEWLGQMALPLALLGIGGALARTKLAGAWKAPAAASAIKVLASPLIGFGLARWVGLNAFETAMVAIYLACPTAGISYTMVTQLEGDEALASSTIFFSTVASVGALALIVGLM